MHEVKVPGKLMLAGDYAVLEPHQKALMIAVERYVSVKVTVTDQCTDDEQDVESLKKLPYVWEALILADAYCQHLGYYKSTRLKPGSIQVQISSELDDEATGKKLGLGSSAAVTVGTVMAFLAYFEVATDPFLIYKLAFVAHRRVQGSGSGADIAACTYGASRGIHEFILYTTPSQDVLEGCFKMSLKELIQMVKNDWLECHIDVLPMPKHMTILIAWTQKPSKTQDKILSYETFKAIKQKEHDDFIKQMGEGMALITHGIQEQDLDEFASGLWKQRQALRYLTAQSQIPIETKQLQQWIESIKSSYKRGMLIAAKSSGAGGGDCGFLILDTSKMNKHKKTVHELMKAMNGFGLTCLLNTSGDAQ